MSTIPSELLSKLTGAPPPLIAGHVTPDADCLCSMFALAEGIQLATGRTVRCAVPQGSLSQRLAFLTNLAHVSLAPPDQCQGPLIAVCDTARERRTNLPDAIRQNLKAGRFIINIDHHASNTMFGDINYVDAAASSTAELIYRIFRHAGWPISTVTATLLYAGIHADTVGFSLSSATPAALAAAADLARLGADVALIGDRLLRFRTAAEFQLRRVVYDNTKLSDSGRIAYSTAGFEEIARTGCIAADIDDQVEIPRSLAGTRLAILFTEGNRGKVRINLRGKAGVSVLELARQIGGGGHQEAAGAIMDGPLEDAVARLIPQAEAYLDNHRPAAVEERSCPP